MKNHLNILPKLASFDLKCSKMRWRLGLRPRPRWGSLRRSPRSPNRKRQRAFGARHSLFRVHFFISIPPSGPPYGIPGSATADAVPHHNFGGAAPSKSPPTGSPQILLSEVSVDLVHTWHKDGLLIKAVSYSIRSAY